MNAKEKQLQEELFFCILFCYFR